MGSHRLAQPHLPLKSSPFRIFFPRSQLPLAEIKIFVAL
jgi:hypothetical protein